MPATHHLSYLGDPALVSAFLRMLDVERVATHDEPLSIAEQIRKEDKPVSRALLRWSGLDQVGPGQSARAVRSEGQGKVVERDADSILDRHVDSDGVVAAAQVLHKRVPSRDSGC